MSDTRTMLEQSIATIQQAIESCNQSIDLQHQAIETLNGSEPVPPDDRHVIHVVDNLQEAITNADDGDILIVNPSLVTQGDILIDRSVELVGASITGFVDVTAGDVHLIGCSITGPHASGALLSTADGLQVQGCRLVGSINGQHRGIWLRSQDVIITDTSVTNIWKDGQESQAIGGWDGCGHIIIERCWLEAAGENFMLGGEDSDSEDTMPHDIQIRDCVLTKPLQWRDKGFAVKNIFEIKCVRNFLMERCILEYSWVEGQIGFAMVINVRNQNGAAPWSTIEDVIIRDCTIRHMAGGIQFLGTDYTHPSGTMRNVTIQNCMFEDISPDYGANQRCLQFSQGGQNIALRGNTFAGADINSFMIFEGTPLEGFSVTDNTFPEGDYGIKSDDTAIGTPTLEKYAPDCEWVNNTVVRTKENNYPYPEGTTIVNE